MPDNGILVLLFYIRDVKYSIRCDKIIEIAPLVALKQIPHTPAYFAGYFNYRGTIVPVIDLCQLIENQSCRLRLSSRIIIVEYIKETGIYKQAGRSAGQKPEAAVQKPETYIIGILAERVTETVWKLKEAFTPPSIRSEGAPYLGGIIMEDGEMIQYLNLDHLPDCVKLLPAPQNGDMDGSAEY